MSYDVAQAVEIQNIAEFAQFIAGPQVGSHSQVNNVVQVSEVSTPILQVQEAINNGTVIQVSDSSMAPVVQVSDQNQGGLYIADGVPGGFQILDGSFQLVQNGDGAAPVIQLPQHMLASVGDGLTQVVQFASGHIALIEQQENIDPQQTQNIQYVLEQVPQSQASQLDGEMQQQQQQLMDAVAPSHVLKKDQEVMRPPIGKGPYTCEICEKVLDKWNQYQRHLRSHEDDKPFRCIHCPASFNVADNLKLHLDTHVKPGAKPSCSECGKKFTRIASLKAHIMMHEKEESLMCQECGDEFGLQSQLDRHMIEHREEKDGTRVYACRQCNAEFSSQKILKEHTKQHLKIKSSLSHRQYNREVDRSGFTHKCNHCSKTFQKPSQLERHVRVHTGDRPYKCNLCTKAFNQKGALQIHMLGRHTEKKPHKCQFCGVGFSQKGNLRAHIQRVHTLTEDVADNPVYSCTDCSCVFRKLGSLNAHISRFHTEEPVLYKKRKKVLLEMTEGEVVGEGEAKAGMADSITQTDPTSTDVINQLLEFSESGNPTGDQQQQQQQQALQQQQGEMSEDILQQALQNSGLPGNNKEKPTETVSMMNVRDTATGVIKKHLIRKVGNITWHQCTYCQKEFKKPSDLVRHIRIHSHEKPYKCTQCFRAFAVKSTLNSHIRTHTGIKQFVCNVCERSFSTQGSLKVHLRLHTGAKPFDCPHCDKKFRSAAHKKNHIASHFKNEKGIHRPKGGQMKKSGNRDPNLPDITLQEPILITDTGLIQQPPRSTMFNQYLGESGSVDRPYKCTYCQRGFKKSSHLKQHVRSHTGEKPYKCLTCMRTFVSNGVLKAHIRVHTGLKQYKCLMCDNMFTTNGSLKRHMSTHSDVRPFMCPYCQRTFKTNVNCKKHMKTHRHELAIQSMNQPSNMDTDENPDHEETTISEETEYVEEEAVDNDLTLVQHELNSAAMTVPQTDLNQQTILSQAGLQDALGLSGTNIEQQILTQPMFNQQSTFTQSLLGSGQQNFAQMNSQMNALSQQTQFQLQHQEPVEQQQQQPQQQQLQQLDLAQFGHQTVSAEVQSLPVQHGVETVVIEDQTSVQALQTPVQQTGSQLTADMPSTSMQNILETRDVDDEDVEDVEGEGGQLPKASVTDDGRKMYPCSMCDKVYKKSSHLKQHLRSHTGERPYRCARCDKSFVSMGVLRQHLRTHTGVKEYKCDVCGALFTTNGSLSRHYNIHVTVKPYKCPFCLEAFRTAAICKRHMKEHEDGEHGDTAGEEEEEESSPTSAEKEPPLVQLTSALTKGTGDDIGLSERILVESASERERISELKELSIQQEEKHAHQCNHCAKSFKKPSDLVRHTRIHTGEKPFSCNVCHRMFTVKSTLDSHMKTHGGVEKTIKCHVCNSMFSTKGSLKVHMRLHTGAKPFRCPHCPQKFRTSGHRKSHIMAHYKPVGSNRKKRNSQNFVLEEIPANQPLDFINTVEQAQQQASQPANPQAPLGQVINIDQSMIQSGNILPLSVTVDNYGNLTESALAAHVLQGLEGLQLQLSGGNLGQGIQITGLDPSIFNQAVQIDASLLQQLQAGNVNITLNQGQVQAADPNLVQNVGNVQIQTISGADAINPNLMVQPVNTMTMDQTAVHAGLQQQQLVETTETAPSSFVVAADGTLSQQQIEESTQVVQSLEGQAIAGVDNIVVVSGDMNPVQTVTLEQASLDPANNTSGEVLSVVNAGEMASTLHVPAGMEQGNMVVIDPSITQGMSEDILEEDSGQEAGGSEDEADLEGEGIIEVKVVEEGTEGHELQDDRLMRPQDVASTFATEGHMVNSQVTNRPHECTVCSRLFNRLGHLKEHMRTHTVKKDKQLMVHQCPYCEKSFQKPSQMDRHVRIHTGERPYICELCNKAFNQKNALQMHLKKHSGDRPHRCSYCEMTFTQKGNLKTHVKRTHHLDMVNTMNLVSEDKFDKPEVLEETGDVVQPGKYVDGDETSDRDQVVHQDLNLQVADIFNN